MAKRRLPAWLLAITMWLSCLAVPGIWTAAEVTWSDATVGQWATLTADSAILGETNLLAGIAPTTGTTGTAVVLGSETAISVSTDGQLAVKNDGATYVSYKINRGPNYRQMTYNLGGKYSVQDFVLAACADSPKYAPHHICIYVSDSVDTLYTEDSLVIEAEKFDVTGHQWQFKAAEAAVGRFVGFEVYSPPWLGADHTVNQTDNPECYDASGNLIYAEWHQYLRTAEIGVYGEAVADEPVEPTWNDATAGQWATLTADSAILGETNLLAGIAPTTGTTGTAVVLGSETAISVSTDGQLAVKNDGTTYVSYKINRGPNYRQMTYNLGGKYSVQDFVLAACADSPKYAPHHIRIYVSDSVDTLYTEDNLVIKAEKFDVTGNQWQFKAAEAAVGRFVGFEVYSPPWLGADHTVNQTDNPECYDAFGNLIYTEWHTYLRTAEIGVYGEAVADEPVEYTWADATMGQWRPLDEYSTILDETNLLDSVVATNGTAGTAIEIKNNGAVVSTDGKLSVAGDTTTSMSYKAPRGAWMQATYALRGLYNLQNFVYSSSLEGSKYAPHLLRIYVSETEENLYAEENLMVKAEKFDVSGQSWEFKAAEAKQGRYVGFELYCPPWLGADHTVNQTDNPECYDADGNLIYIEWWQQVRIGEIGAYGELLEALPEPNYTSQPVTKSEDIPADNLLLGTAVEGKVDTAGNPIDYLAPTDNGGGGLTTAGESSAAQMVDGLIYGINTPEGTEINGAGLERVTSGGFVYDLRGKATIDKILISATTDKDPSYRITYLEVYAADSLANLFAGDPVLRVDLRGNPNQLITLKESVTARYFGFKAPKIGIYDVIRIGELGVYGTYADAPRPFEDNLILGQQAIDSYLAWTNEAGREMKGASVQLRNAEEYGEKMEFLTDGNLTNRVSLYALGGITDVEGYTFSTANGGDGRKLEPNTPWIVQIYHLGGMAQVNSISLTSSNEPGFFVAGVEFYASDRIATLFDKENCLLDTKGGTTYESETGKVLLDPAYDVKERAITCDLFDQGGVQARYVAFVITRAHPADIRGYSIARVSELSVNGKLLDPDPVFDPATQTVTDQKTGISATISQLNMDDVAFFDGLQLAVTESDLPAGISKNFDDNWLHVDSKVYTLTLKDKNGRTYTPEEVGERIWDIRIPKTGDYFQMAASLADNTLTRVRSSYTDPTGQFVKMGTAYGNESTIYGNGMSYVLVRYNTKAEQDALNNVLLRGPVTYNTQGATAAEAPLPVWPAAIVVALLAGVLAVVLIRRRRVNQ